jgi:hypothetical protein
LEFERGADLHPVEVEHDCNCRVFYVCYRSGPVEFGPAGIDFGGRGPGRRFPIAPSGPRNQLDYLAGILKPLHPRTFKVESPLEFRKALATILAEISKL